MRIQTTCPHCAASYALDEQFLGKKGRCKTCGQTFVVTITPPSADPGYEEVIEDELQPAGSAALEAGAPPLVDGPETATPRFKKKKEREKPEGLPYAGLFCGKHVAFCSQNPSPFLGDRRLILVCRQR